MGKETLPPSVQSPGRNTVLCANIAGFDAARALQISLQDTKDKEQCEEAERDEEVCEKCMIIVVLPQ